MGRNLHQIINEKIEFQVAGGEVFAYSKMKKEKEKRTFGNLEETRIK